MYKCSNCGDKLRFDIESQKLKCNSCENLVDAYEVDKDGGAKADEGFDAKLYMCPQCGGEMYSTEEMAVGFCNYCGGESILSDRMKHLNKVKYIVPFSQSKEACREAYAKYVNDRLFVSDELKSTEFVDGFRGVYIPFWSYKITQKGRSKLTGSKDDYSKMVSNLYELDCYTDMEYDGMTFDAASKFSDSISEQIAPYDMDYRKDFTPAYLSGFYADVNDVPDDVYKAKAMEAATQQSVKYIKNQSPFDRVTVSEEQSAAKLNTQCEESSIALLPVWFMSYRNKNRVAYTTINGQTGEAYADLPVDFKKYLLASLLLALPVFMILNLGFVLEHAIALSLSALFSVVLLWVYVKELLEIKEKDLRVEDAGYVSTHREKISSYKLEETVRENKMNTVYMGWSIIIGGVIIGWIPGTLIFGNVFMGIVWWFAIGIFLLKLQEAYIQLRDTFKISEMSGIIYSAVAIVAAFVICLINPVHDNWYYGGIILTLVAEIFTLLDIMNKHNMVVTRKMPYFDRQGGDDNA